jgi:hypothetical protein
LSPGELERFGQEFRLYTTDGTSISDFALVDKVYLSQGHVVILIGFLQSIKMSPPPDDVLELTLTTLLLIIRNLTVAI